MILITCDTLRADRLGIYGYEHDTSPNLDRFAQDCLVFDSAFSAASLTTASVTTLMTGRLPDEHGVHGTGDLLPAEATTLAEVLSDEELPTAAIVSNWVLRKRDEQAGLHQGFGFFDDRMQEPEKNRAKVLERTAAATTDAALEWCQTAPEGPFFLWVHYQDPHGPYTPPEEYVDLLERPLTDEAALEVGKMHNGNGAIPGYQALGEERRPEAYRLRYDAEIRYFDRELGRLLEGLESRDLVREALILFTSDHGENLGEHGQWFCHGQNLHVEQVRMPLLVRAPESAGLEPRRVGSLASHVDLFATVLNALGIMAPPSHGRDLLGSELDQPRVVVQTLAAPDQAWRWSAVTDASHRLVIERGRPRLYDRHRDPLELEDLSQSLPGRVGELERAHRALLNSLSTPVLTAERPRLSQSELEHMEALGYGGDEEHE